MATQSDVRRIALALPGTVEARERFAFSVPSKGKKGGYAWVWNERVHPKKARVPNPAVIALRTANLDDKEFLLALDSGKFFTEPHYDGFPAVLVRLRDVTVRELRPLIKSAWETVTPKPKAPRRKPIRR